MPIATTCANEDRRDFLRTVGAAAIAVPVIAMPYTASAESSPVPSVEGQVAGQAPGAATGYQFFSLDEATFTEVLVEHMWPRDELSPSGLELGIPIFIDRQLAGAFGQGDRLYLQGPFRKGKPQHGYQLPMTPAEYYRAGSRTTSAVCRKRYGVGFDRLQSGEREQFLQDLAGGKVAEGAFDLAVWFNTLVYPLFERGAFADPIYGGNRDKLAWQMIGYPGLPATYSQDVVRYRGKPYPRAANPQSIQDFS